MSVKISLTDRTTLLKVRSLQTSEYLGMTTRSAGNCSLIQSGTTTSFSSFSLLDFVNLKDNMIKTTVPLIVTFQ